MNKSMNYAIANNDRAAERSARRGFRVGEAQKLTDENP
jgi:hypothetical protein